MMDKQLLVANLAKLTADLSPFRTENAGLLKDLQNEFAKWIVFNNKIDQSTALQPAGNEPNISPELKTQLTELIEKTAFLANDKSGDLHIVKREALSTSHIDGSDATAWAQGRRPNKSLGPFTDLHGGLVWYDMFSTTQLNSLMYKGDQIPFLKFSTTDIFALSTHREILLQPGSIWIKANYLNKQAPHDAFIGLKISGGRILLSGGAAVNGNNMLLDTGTVCNLTLKLAPPSLPFNNNLKTGNDARVVSVHPPGELDLRFTFQNGSFNQLSDGEFSLYKNTLQVSWQEQQALYDDPLKRILVPVRSQVQQLDISQVLSTLFAVSGKGKITAIFWELPVTTGDHNKLGEALGCGGYLVRTEKGFRANWNNLDASVTLAGSSWLVEPGRLELYTLSLDVATAHFLLWHKTERRCSATIKLLKNYSVKYICSAADELEMVQIDADLKGFLDRPLTTDGKRIDINYTKGMVAFGQYKAENLLSCAFYKILEKKFNEKLLGELKPVSMALSNAYAKISPCDEFHLGGKITNNNEISSGICALTFGLYALMPIFPDPYVSNLHVNNERRAQINWQLEFANYLLVQVNWKDIFDPLMSFHLRNNQGPFFRSMQSDRKHINEQLRNRMPAAWLYSKTENPVSAILDKDMEDENSLKNHFQDISGGRHFPDIFILDVSGKEDQFGIGLSNRALDVASFDKSFGFAGIELISKPENLSVITLPPIQWEAISTVPNPNVLPKDFPSPAHSLDTGDPAVLRTLTTFELIPVVPAAVMNDFVKSFGEAIPKAAQRGAAFLNLPFGLKSYLQLRNAVDNDVLYEGVNVENNRPEFKHPYLTGGNQLSLVAFHNNSNNTERESPGFPGATIQTRNLVDKSGLTTGLSVLGPFVDTIFNDEFRPGGKAARVPLSRVDISGYGASIFSNWRNPDAQIATTSQAKFDVLIGRTAHEIIQVKSILYCCGASVVRTITIQRNAGGGVTRHDSGWVAEGPGLFDFSYKPLGSSVKVNSPFEFHKGLLKGYYNITNIRDSMRIVEVPALKAGDAAAKFQEVFFDAGLLIDDVVKGRVNGFVSAKNQKGFVQLEPSGTPVTADQLTYLLKQEGAIGGQVDCTVNIGGSGQEMRVVRVDTNPQFGASVFVNALRGSLVLPAEGNWGIVQQKSNAIETIQNNNGVPLVKYNSTPLKYQFREPAEDPLFKFGLVHTGDSHRVLFPAPYITLNDPHISSEQPAFADFYALLNSNNIFPAIGSTFPVGAGEGKLKIHGSGVLELVSQGKLTITPGQRKIYKDASYASYIEYFDKNNKPAEGSISINPFTAEKWKAEISNFKQVYDIGTDQRVKLFHISYQASGIQPAKLDKPSLEFGASLKPVGDMIRMLDDDDLGEMEVDCHNIKSAFKYKFSYEAKIEFELHDAGYEKKIHFLPQRHKETGEKAPIFKYYGIPAFLPPYLYIIAKLGVLVSHDEHGEHLNLKMAATVGFQCMNVLKVVGIYAVGILEYEAKFGTKVRDPISPLNAGSPMALVKETSFKIVAGCAFRINLFKIGEIEGMRGFGIEYSTEEKHVIAILTQKAEIAIATCSIGVTIEAKAPVEKLTDSIDPMDPLKTIDKFVGAFELTLIIELSAAYVINFEYEYTWKELNNVF